MYVCDCDILFFFNPKRKKKIYTLFGQKLISLALCHGKMRVYLLHRKKNEKKNYKINTKQIIVLIGYISYLEHF